MRKFGFLLLLLCAACGAASSDSSERLVGTWVVDADAFRELPIYRDAPEEEQMQLDQMLNFIDLEFTFTKDQVTFKAEALGNTKSESASYTVANADGDRLTLDTVDKNGRKERIVAELNGDVLVLGKGKEKFALKKKLG